MGVRKKFKEKSKDTVDKTKDLDIKENISKEESQKSDYVADESVANVDVRIPTSDTTDVLLTVKPTDVVRNQRIHVKVKESRSPQVSQSRKIVYGKKSVISHHLR